MVWVVCKWGRLRPCTAKDPVTKALGILACMPHLGRAPINTGDITSEHCFLVRVVAMRGYSRVFMMEALRVYQASCCLI